MNHHLQIIIWNIYSNTNENKNNNNDHNNNDIITKIRIKMIHNCNHCNHIASTSSIQSNGTKPSINSLSKERIEGDSKC